MFSYRPIPSPAETVHFLFFQNTTCYIFFQNPPFQSAETVHYTDHFFLHPQFVTSGKARAGRAVLVQYTIQVSRTSPTRQIERRHTIGRNPGKRIGAKQAVRDDVSAWWKTEIDGIRKLRYSKFALTTFALWSLPTHEKERKNQHCLIFRRDLDNFNFWLWLIMIYCYVSFIYVLGFRY